jgi:hypothetical protein
MFTTDVPTYLIDLDRDEGRRWEEVISREKTAASRVVQEAGSQFERVPELLRWVFARLYQRSGGLYRGEITSWAEALGVSLGTATILNCAYELSHLRWPKLFGCTAGVRWVDGPGMVHIRSLDWPWPASAPPPDSSASVVGRASSSRSGSPGMWGCSRACCRTRIP